MSGHQFFRNDTGAASRSDVSGSRGRYGRRWWSESIRLRSLRPVVYQTPLRITSIKTLGAPRWSRRSRPPLRPLLGGSRFYYFPRMLPGVGALAWVKTAGTPSAGRGISPPIHTRRRLYRVRKKMSYRPGSRSAVIAITGISRVPRSCKLCTNPREIIYV